MKTQIISEDDKEQRKNLMFDIIDKCIKTKGCPGCNRDTAREKHRGDDKCDTMKAWSFIFILLRSNFPKNFWVTKFTDLILDIEVKTDIDYYISYIDNAISKSIGMLFYGNSGTGKTTTMLEIGKRLIAKNYEVRFFTFSQLIKATQTNDKEFIDNFLGTADIYLIDELDKSYIKKGSDYNLTVLHDFLRVSRAENKTCFITTNWTPEDISDTFGESMLSFLKRSYMFIEMNDIDRSVKNKSDLKSVLPDTFDYLHPNLMEIAVTRPQVLFKIEVK